MATAAGPNAATRRVFVAGLVLGLALVTGSAGAEDPLVVLLPKLAVSSARLEAMWKGATYTVSGRMENVSSDGAASDPKEGTFRVVGDGSNPPKVEVVRYTEDGKDKTDEAREKAAERAKNRKPKKPDEEVHMPFLGTEQGKYDYKVGESDPRDPARVRVYFTPRWPAQNLLVGSAWVDSRTGDVLSMGASPSKTPAFVDYLRVTIEFGEATPMGPAPSKIAFEGSAGFLFLKKKFRGSATLSGWQARP